MDLNGFFQIWRHALLDDIFFFICVSVLAQHFKHVSSMSSTWQGPGFQFSSCGLTRARWVGGGLSTVARRLVKETPRQGRNWTFPQPRWRRSHIDPLRLRERLTLHAVPNDGLPRQLIGNSSREGVWSLSSLTQGDLDPHANGRQLYHQQRGLIRVNGLQTEEAVGLPLTHNERHWNVADH